MLVFGLDVWLFALAGVGVAVATLVIRHLVVGGVCDEVEFPLGNCDTSMLEENLSEVEK